MRVPLSPQAGVSDAKRERKKHKHHKHEHRERERKEGEERPHRPRKPKRGGDVNHSLAARLPCATPCVPVPAAASLLASELVCPHIR